MTLHDSYARFTPYELAFPNLDHLEELILGVEEEAKNQGLDLSNLNTFFAMGHVDAFVREIQGPDALPETIYQYVTLVFHAVHFNQAGCPIYLLSENVARDLLENHPGGQPTPPESSGYIQLPQHLLWMSGADSDTPESIDGVFWVLSNRGILHSLLVAGLRPDRPAPGRPHRRLLLHTARSGRVVRRHRHGRRSCTGRDRGRRTRSRAACPLRSKTA